MQECTAANIWIVKHEAEIINYENENALLQKGILAGYNPDNLRKLCPYAPVK